MTKNLITTEEEEEFSTWSFGHANYRNSEYTTTGWTRYFVGQSSLGTEDEVVVMVGN